MQKDVLAFQPLYKEKTDLKRGGVNCKSRDCESKRRRIFGMILRKDASSLLYVEHDNKIERSLLET